jgi:2-alkenal reductase
MRPGQLAALSLISAVIGAALVIAVGSALGWIGATETVVAGGGVALEEEPEPAFTPANVAPLSGDGFDPAAIYAARADGVVTVYTLFGDDVGSTPGQGSGFVVSPDGYVLTNSHVITNAGGGRGGARGSGIRGATEVYVEFSDGDRIPAEIVGWDVFDDVGLLKLDQEAHDLTPLPLGDSARVSVGEPVAAIGSPFGAENSLAVGIVSATRRSIDALTSQYQLVDAIQTDAPINRGNSGGPLFDARGVVIGINAQIRSDSGLSEGVGFAVPINAAKRSMAELIERGEVAYAYAGLTTGDLTRALARHLGLEPSRGALVADIVPDGPAEEAGIQGGERTIVFQGRDVRVGGDVVVAVNGRRIANGDDLVRAVTNDLRPGETAVFTLYRGGRRLDVPIELAERPLDPPPTG